MSEDLNPKKRSLNDRTWMLEQLQLFGLKENDVQVKQETLLEAAHDAFSKGALSQRLAIDINEECVQQALPGSKKYFQFTQVAVRKFGESADDNGKRGHAANFDSVIQRIINWNHSLAALLRADLNEAQTLLHVLRN